jgi:hypothetical protein
MLICVAHARAHTQASLKSIRTCWLWRTCESTSRNPATYEKTPRPYARGIQEACCNTVVSCPPPVGCWLLPVVFHPRPLILAARPPLPNPVLPPNALHTYPCTLTHMHIGSRK